MAYLAQIQPNYKITEHRTNFVISFWTQNQRLFNQDGTYKELPRKQLNLNSYEIQSLSFMADTEKVYLPKPIIKYGRLYFTLDLAKVKNLPLGKVKFLLCVKLKNSNRYLNLPFEMMNLIPPKPQKKRNKK